MRQLKFAPLIAILLATSLPAFQAANTAQPAPAQAGQPSTQKAKAQSECMEWAKQQVGLSKPSNSQQAASTADANKTGTAAPSNGAAANNGTAAQPAANASQATSGSAMTGAAEQLAGSMGVANTQMTQLVENAYTKCMHKKGYKTK